MKILKEIQIIILFAALFLIAPLTFEKIELFQERNYLYIFLIFTAEFLRTIALMIMGGLLYRNYCIS